MKQMISRPIVWVAGAAALVALLVIARPVLYPPAVPAQQTSNPTATRTGSAPVVPVVDLNLSRLNTAGRELPQSQRDPFRFRPRAAPPAQRVPAAAPPPPVFTPPVQAGPPPVPRIPLRYFGLIGITNGGQRIAAFRDERGNTFNGKEGDILEGRYRLVRIGQDSVELEYLDGRGRQTIRLTGQ